MWSAQGQEPESEQPCQKSNYTFVSFVSTYQTTEYPMLPFFIPVSRFTNAGAVTKTNGLLFLSNSVIFETAEMRRYEFEISLRTVLGVLTNLQKFLWLWNLSCVAENARLKTCSLSLHKCKQCSCNPEDICWGSILTIFMGARADSNRCLDRTCQLKKTCMNINIRIAMGDKIKWYGLKKKKKKFPEWCKAPGRHAHSLSPYIYRD